MNAFFDRWVARVRAVFAKPALDAEFDSELAHHLEQHVSDLIKEGMMPDEAARQARIALGGIEQLKELHRDSRGLPFLEQVGRDLSYGLRVLNRERGFATVALLVLAIGIGLNTTVFSLVNTVLLRPIPFTHADRLVWIFNGDPAASSHDLSGIASQVDTWEGLRETSRSLEQIEAYNPFSVRQTYRLTGAGDPETILSVDVSYGLFGMLGVKPLIGRLFLPEDGVKNAPGRIILSHQLWQRRYGSDPRIVGQTIQINGGPVEVIGVLPPADTFTSVFFPAVRVDTYAALSNDEARNWGNTVSLIGHARPGASIDQIRSDLLLSVAQIKKEYPNRNPYFAANVISLHDWVAGSLKRPLQFLWIAAGLVLAIVNFNLGGLLLAKGASRRKELALRCALGAGRARIAWQLLTECFVLVATGTLLGGLVAWGFIHFLAVRSSVEIPLLNGLRLDASALSFTVLLSAITVASCGALPVWKLARVGDIQKSLNDEGRGSSGGRNRSRTRSILVIAEVALACVLAVSAGLLVRSLLNLLAVDLGFRPQNLVAVRIDPVGDGPKENYLEEILDHVRALPGIEHAALTDCVPVERDRSWGIYPVNKDNPKDQRWTGAHIRIVSSGLFAAMGTTLVAGRDFDRTDAKDAPGAIIINQALANQFWPGESAVGRQVNVNGNFPGAVIGVVANVRHDGPEIPSGNEMYLSLHQVNDGSSWDMIVRTKLPVAALTAGLRDVLRPIDATLPLTKVRPMQALVDRTLSSRRLLVWLIGGFAAIAVGLSALGLYGVISYMVSQQTKEIGIRMALGADASTVQRHIVLQTMKLAFCGLAFGIGTAFVAGRGLNSMLYGVSPEDPTNYFVATLILLTCALFAGYIPARHASRVDPLIALRTD
jgi:predicted permease